MQVSGRRAARRFTSIAALTLLSATMTGALSLSLDDATTQQEELVARRAYFVGTTPEIRKMVQEQESPHRAELGNQKEVADFEKPPPACGVRLHKVFADYCVSQLKVAMAPCSSAPDHALCSTGYLAPSDQRIYWRLRYRRVADQASLELEAVRRVQTGRLEPVVVGGDKFEELFDLLLKASRCEGT